MSECNENKRYAHLTRLGTQELEELLRADMELPGDADTEMILYIMEVIKQRENGHSTEAAADTERAWMEFQQHYNTPESVGKSLYTAEINHSTPETVPKHNHLRFRTMIAVAAVIILTVIFMIPPVLGYENFSQMIGQWTEEMFQFEWNSASPAVSQSTDSNGLQEDKKYTNLQEALDDYGITESVLPTTIPDGFVLVSIGVDESPDFGVIEFYAFYEKGDAALSILVTQHLSNSGSLKYEKDENPVQEYVENGTTYYLFENNGVVVAAYWIGNLECSISGDIIMDELIEMVDSIK